MMVNTDEFKKAIAATPKSKQETLDGIASQLDEAKLHYDRKDDNIMLYIPMPDGIRKACGLFGLGCSFHAHGDPALVDFTALWLSEDTASEKGFNIWELPAITEEKRPEYRSWLLAINDAMRLGRLNGGHLAYTANVMYHQCVMDFLFTVTLEASTAYSMLNNWENIKEADVGFAWAKTNLDLMYSAKADIEANNPEIAEVARKMADEIHNDNNKEE